MKKYAKVLRRSAAVFSILFLIGFAWVYQAAPYMILTPRKIHLTETPAGYGMPYEKIDVPVNDSLHLRGYWIHQRADTGKVTIILLHGVGGCKEHWLPTAAWLWKKGYETVLLDARAHGESDGQFCTYGYFEKYDVAKVTKYILDQKKGGCVGVWGNSLGAAVAVQALSVEPHLRFGIVESAFADFRTIVFDYQQQRLKIPWHWFADDGIARAVTLAHFEPDSVRPAEAARRVQQPVILAHGDADDRIKMSYGRLIFEHLTSPAKELHIIPGAGHFDLMERGGDAYRTAILQFLQRNR